MAINYDAIPDELKKLDQWVAWRDEGGTKVLKIAAGRATRNASTANPKTWRSFLTARAAAQYADGIGFVFTAADPYIGIDMDNKQGLRELDADHWTWIKTLNSYTERSPSGRGYHVILRGDNIKGFNRSPYEGYSSGRYFTFTGDVVLNLPIAENPRALADFIGAVGAGAEREPFKMPDAVAVGNRNDTLFRLACSMLTRGVDREDVVLLITGFNRGLEKPLPPKEVKALLDSAGSYDYSADPDANMFDWLRENMIWVAGQNAYWDHSQRGLMQPSAVDRAYLKEMPRDEDDKRTPPSAFLMGDERQKVVYDLGWHPTEGEIFDWEGQTRINTYAPGHLVPRSGQPAPWLRHLKWLVPDTDVQERILDWLAYTVQYPGEKINYGLFLGGAERIGKDMLLQPVVQALGAHNCKEIGAGELHSDFNEYAFQTKLLLVGEMHTKLHQQRTVENNLKRLLAGTATQSLPINIKNMRMFRIPNLISVVFMSNHKDALVITGDNAARYLCWWCPVRRKEDTYYEQFGRWLAEEDNAAAVYYYLKTRDLTAFNPKGNAAETEFTREVVEMSRDTLEMEIGLRLTDRIAPFHRNLVTTDDICTAMELPVLQYRMRVNKVLTHMGFKPKSVVGQYQKTLYRRTVYIVRNEEMYAEMTDSALLRKYMEQGKM